MVLGFSGVRVLFIVYRVLGRGFDLVEKSGGNIDVGDSEVEAI